METYRELYNEMKDKLWRTFILHKEEEYSAWNSLIRICVEPSTDGVHDLKIIIEYENIFREFPEGEDHYKNMYSRMTHSIFDPLYILHFQRNGNKVDITIPESGFYNDLHVNIDDRFNITFSSVPFPSSTIRSIILKRLDYFKLEEVILKPNKNIIYRNINVMTVPLVKFFNDHGLPTTESLIFNNSNNENNPDGMIQIVFDDAVSIREINRFMSEHLDENGEFNSFGSFAGVLSYNNQKSEHNARYVYIASNSDMATIDLNQWINDIKVE